MFCHDVLSGCSVRKFCQDVLSGCSFRMFCQDVLTGCSVRLFCQDVLSGVPQVSVIGPTLFVSTPMILFEMIAENLDRGGALIRSDLLKPRPAYPLDAVLTIMTKPTFKPNFILTFISHIPDLRSWLRETYFILQLDRKMSNIYPLPISVVYRQSPCAVYRQSPGDDKFPGAATHSDGSDQDDQLVRTNTSMVPGVHPADVICVSP